MPLVDGELSNVEHKSTLHYINTELYFVLTVDGRTAKRCRCFGYGLPCLGRIINIPLHKHWFKTRTWVSQWPRCLILMPHSCLGCKKQTPPCQWERAWGILDASFDKIFFWGCSGQVQRCAGRYASGKHHDCFRHGCANQAQWYDSMWARIVIVIVMVRVSWRLLRKWFQVHAWRLLPKWAQVHARQLRSTVCLHAVVRIHVVKSTCCGWESETQRVRECAPTTCAWVFLSYIRFRLCKGTHTFQIRIYWLHSYSRSRVHISTLLITPFSFVNYTHVHTFHVCKLRTRPHIPRLSITLWSRVPTHIPRWQLNLNIDFPSLKCEYAKISATNFMGTHMAGQCTREAHSKYNGTFLK